MWNENKPLLSGYFFRGIHLSTNILGSKIESVFNHLNNAFPNAGNRIGAVWKNFQTAKGC